MYLKNILSTLSSKGIIMLLTFGLVILSTNLWGATGRGHISIIIADLTLIVAFNNLLAGSCITFYTPKLGIEKLILPAYIWVTISSLIGTLVFCITQSDIDFFYLFFLSVFFSFQAIHLKIFLANENFRLFNSLSLLLPLLNVVFILLFEFLLQVNSYKSYFAGYLLALVIVWVVSAVLTLKYFKEKIVLSFSIIKQTLTYGWQIELSNLLNFFNYRLSYFIILYFMDIGTVGLYSVGIALAESIWLITRSISTVLYSKILNTTTNEKKLQLTKESAKLSLYFSLIVMVLLLIVPSNIYTLIFGRDFFNIKTVLVLLLPGIIVLAFANVHGHYFSATGQSKTFLLKSIVGLIVTLALGPILIKLWGLHGAGIVTSLSFIASSIYLIICFYKTTPFAWTDVWINPRKAINAIIKK